MKNNTPKRGEIWLVQFNPTRGDEIQKTRPAIRLTTTSRSLPVILSCLLPFAFILFTDMKRNFPLWYVQLILLMIVLLTACSSSTTTQLGTQQRLTGNLLVWHFFQGEEAKIFQGYLDSYQQLNPEIKIISEYIPKLQISAEFIKQVKAGLGPDLLINSSREIPTLADAETLQTIQENTVDFSAYFPQAIEQVRYREKFYGLPFSFSLQVLCYNKEKVKQSPLEKSADTNNKSTNKSQDQDLTQPPKTLEALLNRARKGYSVGIVSTFEGTFWGIAIFDVQLFDEKGNPQPELGGWAKWLDWLKKADNEPNVILNQYRDVLHRSFLQGKLAYYVCDSNEIDDLRKDLKDNLGVALLPSQPNRVSRSILSTKALLFNRESNPEQTQLALGLAQFMTNTEQQMRGIIQSQAFIPANQNVIFDTQLLPIESVLKEQAKTGRTIPLDYIKPTISIIEQGEHLQEKAIAGNITPAQATAELTKIVNQEFNRRTVDAH